VLVDNHFTDVITELQRVRNEYYDSIFEDCEYESIVALKKQMNYLQNLADNGQEFIVNF
jgi:hypothetical protein